MSRATNDGIAIAVITRLEANLITAGGLLWPLKNQNKDHTTSSPFIEYIPSPDRPNATVSGGDLNGFILVNVWVPKNHGTVESMKQGEIIISLFKRGTEMQATNQTTGELFTVHLGLGDIEPQRNGSGDRDKLCYTSTMIRYEALSCP